MFLCICFGLFPWIFFAVSEVVQAPLLKISVFYWLNLLRILSIGSCLRKYFPFSVVCLCSSLTTQMLHQGTAEMCVLVHCYSGRRNITLSMGLKLFSLAFLPLFPVPFLDKYAHKYVHTVQRSSDSACIPVIKSFIRPLSDLYFKQHFFGLSSTFK